MMREEIIESLCDNMGFEVLNRRSDFWIIGDNQEGEDSFEMFYIADIRDKDADTAVIDIFKKAKEMNAARDENLRLHLMIITDKRIPENLQDDDTIYDFLWILNTGDKCMKIITSESLRESNFMFIRSNKLNVLKNLILETIRHEAKNWKIY